MRFHLRHILITDRSRALLGFGLGAIIMLVVVRIFVVNSFDFENMQRGVRLILSGVNPWAAATHIDNFYNPPFSVLFLWPMMFTSPKVFLVIGGACLMGLVFYTRAWVALAWFVTNLFLLLVALGGIDMFVIGAGLGCLLAGDQTERKSLRLIYRVMGYGLLMVKPQGGFFITALYILSRRDWKSLLLSCLIYGLPFVSLYPGWISTLLNNTPTGYQAHTVMNHFGLPAALLLAGLVALSRKWTPWQLGGALSGILMPYGMIGIPTFLLLTGVRKRIVIPVVVILGGILTMLTWKAPPPGVEFYTFITPLMAIYHLGMFGMALILACLSDPQPGSDS